MKCERKSCDWQGSVGDGARKNFFAIYCPTCGYEIAIPPGELFTNMIT